jgi:hypothetical protein
MSKIWPILNTFNALMLIGICTFGTKGFVQSFDDNEKFEIVVPKESLNAFKYNAGETDALFTEFAKSVNDQVTQGDQTAEILVIADGDTTSIKLEPGVSFE